ncbi:transcriptional regulator family: bZIP [Penicillium chermesinum]|uniref:Transcriptional regulator family: bZIP n=1 Tax=Penicillium chermesinum TaxID=63820 RepID=A0A9W9NZY6_9EURO|nr:transcriptional regulator family: bZIP [Penicillium chermesinum]KAJ5232984.1 transcriptional regulator family: bZIP [Penicillium chermesinum]KAJ6172630.1 transcriptional regulator family: bZIP [Penicillium chermesinum]
MASFNSLPPMSAMEFLQPRDEALPGWLGRSEAPPAPRRASSASDSKPRKQTKKRLSRDAVGPERARQLEKNRIAANKCRKKRKAEQNKIQEDLDAETEKREMLMAEVDSLREEAWHLKNQIFAHSQCGDGELGHQLQHMSSNALQSSTTFLPSPSPLSASTWSSDNGADDSVPENPVAGKSDESFFDTFVNVPV